MYFFRLPEAALNLYAQIGHPFLAGEMTANEKDQCWSKKKILVLRNRANITKGTVFLSIVVSRWAKRKISSVSLW
jgi:hypothetical protein